MPDDRYLRTHPLSHVPILYPALFYDDCNGTLPYSATGDGADYIAAYQTVAPLAGTKQLRLQTRTTGPTTGDAVTIALHTFLTPAKLLRLIAHFKTYQSPPHSILYFAFHWYDGTNQHLAIIRLRTDEADVAYYGPAPNYTTLSGVTFNPTTGHWHRLDFAINVADALYHRLTFDHNIANMQSIAIPTTADATLPHLRLIVTLETTQNALAYCALDQILLLAENP
jgi:hypothetical protein